MKGEITGNVPTVNDLVKTAFIHYTEDVKDVEDVSGRQLETALAGFCALNPDYVIHTSSNKSLMYKINWDVISRLYRMTSLK